MKKQLLFLTLSLSILFSGWSQSITVTSISTNPAEVDAGFTVNINYTTTNANDIIYIGLERKDVNGNWLATMAEKSINPVGTSGTDVAASAIITVPSGITPTADLTGGEYYELKVELNAENWGGWLAGDYPLMTLVPGGTLGVNDENLIKQFTLFPNPVSETLNFKNNNGLAINAIKITNVLGKTVYSQNHVLTLNSIDVSGYSSGLYVLSVKTDKKIEIMKFYKK